MLLSRDRVMQREYLLVRVELFSLLLASSSRARLPIIAQCDTEKEKDREREIGGGTGRREGGSPVNTTISDERRGSAALSGRCRKVERSGQRTHLGSRRFWQLDAPADGPAEERWLYRELIGLPIRAFALSKG